MRRIWLLCLIVMGCAWASGASAAPLERFERLVMPGKLTQGHAKLEKDCNNCHKSFEKGAQNKLCADCHKEAGKDVREQTGFHGKVQDVKTLLCSACHPDHRGREENIMPMDVDNFDHDKSDFPLRGTHERVVCNECHKAGQLYRKAQSVCGECHKNDDAHNGRLGKDCAQCHTQLVWGMSRYDHEKTKFPLKNTHRSVACAACHVNQRYKNTPKGCVTCHFSNDIHEEKNGTKCQECHTENGWALVKFDHDKDTKYLLEGRHATVECQSCHKGDVYKKINNHKSCNICHKLEDAHNALFGEKCEACHVPKSWSRPVFNHTTKTKYPLQGKHRDVACNICHRGDVYAKLEKTCIGCHRKDDAHLNQEGEKCDKCHDESGWDNKVIFDHGLTRFPLLGAHTTITCEDCHFSTAFKSTEFKCGACHEADDAKSHKKRLGQNCGLCHASANWKAWLFNHDKQTEYPLTGKHKGLNCHSCHKEPVKDKIKLGKACIICHESDDIHHGSFGHNCERCHNTESFKQVQLQHR
ncbi:MAG: cytochrome c3 family protein [Pseudomonadota bacterium]